MIRAPIRIEKRMARPAFLLFILAIGGCTGQVSSEALTDRALNGSDPAEREKAILELTRRGPEVLPLVRKVAAESKSPPVRAAAIQTLGVFKDKSSTPMLLDALDDPDPMVRGRAGEALVPLLSADYHFRADDPLPKRKAISRAMRESYENLLKNPELKKK
jgi:HEAT repeat protein